MAGDQDEPGTNYPRGVPNVEKVGFILLSPLEFPDVDQDAAIAKVAARLGRAPVFTDAEGHEREIVGAAVSEDGSRIAWVEGRSKWHGRVMDVEFVLHAQVGDANPFDWTVETYNPFFGCQVGYLGWWGDEVVLIYREKHHSILAAIGAGAAPRLRPIDDAWSLAGDVVYFSSRQARGLVEGARIPELASVTPLAASAAARMNQPLRVPLAENPASFQADLRRALFGDDAAQPEADLIVGALAHRFWERWPEITAEYGFVNRWNSPRWLPLYWSLAAGEQRKDRLLRLLDSLAARTTSEAPTSALTAAVGYVCEQSGILAAACRAGALPEGEHCAFWAEWSLAAVLPHLDAFPEGFRQAVESLCAEQARWRKLTRGY